MKIAMIGFVDIKLGKHNKVVNEDIWKYFSNYMKHKFPEVDFLLFNRETLPGLVNLTDKLNEYDKIIVCGKEPLKYIVASDKVEETAPIEADLEFAEQLAIGDESESDDDENSDEVEIEEVEEVPQPPVIDDPEEEDESDPLERKNSDDDDDDTPEIPKGSDIEDDFVDFSTKTNLNSKVEDLRYFGIENLNSKLKHKRVDVMFSLMYYIAKDLVNVFHFDVLNRTGTNTMVPEMKQIDAKFHKVSEVFKIFEEMYSKDEVCGFDFETRNFPFMSNFRILGFSIVSNNYQAYFYFSRDDEKYALEFEEVKVPLLKLFKDNAKRLIAFNNKFENNVVLHTLRKRVFFEDARIYVQILKTRGSLKFSANLFLGVPIWNETIFTFMNHYKAFVVWMNKFRKVYESHVYDLEQSCIEREVVQEWITDSDVGMITKHFPQVLVNQGENVSLKIVANGDKKNPGHNIVIEKYYDQNDLIEDPYLFMDVYFDAINDGKPIECLKYFSTYVDERVEGKFKLTNLLNYYKNNYNEWQCCGIGDMGYYCILDSYYTLKLKECLYDINYQGISNAYPYYLSQSHLAGMLEANKMHVDPERFEIWKTWNYKERLRLARVIAVYPPLVDNIMEAKLGKTRLTMLNAEIVTIVKGYAKTKSVVARFVAFIKNFNPEIFTEKHVEHLAKLTETKKELVKFKAENPGKKMTKTAMNKILHKGFNDYDKSIVFFKNLINTKIKITVLDSCSTQEEVAQIVSEICLGIKEKATALVNEKLNPDEFRNDYLKLINDPNTTYDQIDKILEFGSSKNTSRQKFIKNAAFPEYAKLCLMKTQLTDRLKLSQNKATSLIEEALPEDLPELIKTIMTGQHESKFNDWTIKDFVKCAQGASGYINKIASGDKFGKMQMRYIKAAWEKANQKYKTIEEYPEFMQFIYHIQLIKRLNKSISTLIKGTLGGGAFIRSKDPMIPIEDPEGEYYFFKTTYWNNDKDTLRWSSAYHTVPSHSDYNACLTGRGPNRLFLHKDLAQAEVRLVFAVSKEQSLVDAVRAGLDIHSLNAFRAFDLHKHGITEETLHLVKEKFDLQRSWAKLLTFAILYQAGVASIAKQIHKTPDEAQLIMDSYYKVNPNLSQFIKDIKQELKDNFGYIRLPIFDHDFYVANPFHYSMNQRSVNYPIQNLSSSLCAHQAFCTYEDLSENHGIEIDFVGFVHDAMEIDFEVKDMFTILDRIDYWDRINPYESLGVPQDYDIALGIDKYSATEFHYEYNEDRTEVTFKYEIKDIFGNKDKIVSMFERNFTMGEYVVEKIKELNLTNFDYLFQSAESYNYHTYQMVDVYKFEGKIKVTWEVVAA